MQCGGLNTEICVECKGLRTSSHPNTFEDMKLTPYLFPNCLVPNISFFPNVKLSFYYVSSLKTSRVVVCRHAWGRGLRHWDADIRPQACMEAAPLWSYAIEMQTYDHRHAWKLRHCGVTPLRCKHMTTGMHGSCTTVELHRYGADIRLQTCMEAAPLRRYTAMVQAYDHRHARRLRHCGVMPLWCRNRAVVLHAHQYDAKLDMLL